MGTGTLELNAAISAYRDEAYKGRITFSTSDETSSNTTVTERMRIDPDGNVGIGNTNPTETLCFGGGSGIQWTSDPVADGGGLIKQYKGSWDASASTTHDIALGIDAPNYHVIAYDALVTLRNDGSAAGMAYSIYGVSRHGTLEAAATIWGYESATTTDPVFVDTGTDNVLRLSAHTASGTVGYNVLLRLLTVS